MKNVIVILAIAALAAVVGCSGDQPGAPTQGGATLWRTDKTIGPSEIVLAVDVSDAVDATALGAFVDAASAALSDAGLVPTDGSIRVAAFVYGDTIAAPFAGLVPVTSDNLTNVILPALAGLTGDRLVTGASADLGAAMTAAGDLLAATGAAADQHLFVLGSGALADTMAVDTACGVLGGAGVAISAITLGEGAPLAACADATGGWFAGGATDPAAALTLALAYLLQADLTLSGSAAELALGADFTATATLFRGSDPEAYPVKGADVTFTVVDGPNAGGPVTVATDTLGLALLTYAGDGGPGTDTVVAAAAHPGTGEALTDTVRVTWLNTPPVCEPGGPYLVTVAADTVTIQLDASASYDADGDTLMYTWSFEAAGVLFSDINAAMPTLTLFGDALCAGDTLRIGLSVNDGYDTSTCEALVVLDDQRPPVVEVLDEPLILWPPNHKFATYTPDMFITGATDACGNPLDLSGVIVLAVSSDEPADAQGDGSTEPDIEISCPDVVSLRAERQGGGDGRVYTIMYRLTDGNGVAADFQAQVVVPHDSDHLAAGEDPVGGYTVTAECGGD